VRAQEWWTSPAASWPARARAHRPTPARPAITEADVPKPTSEALTIREFLEADLVETLDVAVSPVKRGSGSRMWQSPDELLDRFHCDVMPSPSGVTHHLFWRR
jgi:hypothetical protein